MRRKLDLSLPPSAITLEQIEALGIPENSFISKYLDYASLCTDAPPVYHLGTAFSILATAAGKADIMTVDEQGRCLDSPIRMWTAIVGNSGQRKSQAMDLGIDLLDAAGIEHRLPDDASVEAWHDALSARPVAMLQKDELSGLFDARARSYSQGLTSWMLSLWQGRDKDRLTKADGTVWVRRPRLNILGGIPPEVLEKKTTRADWSSGFLPRFVFWQGKRMEWSETWCSHPDLQRPLAHWLQAVPFRSVNRIEIPYTILKPINDWFFMNIEAQQDRINDNLYSALTRLQEKAILFAGLLHISTLQQPSFGGKSAGSSVTDPRVSTIILGIVRILKQVVEGIFGLTAPDRETKDEQDIISIIQSSTHPLTRTELAKKVDYSNTTLHKKLTKLVEIGMLGVQNVSSKKSGRPQLAYFLTDQ